ncbi:MAG: hypothetical protein H6670_11105 [Anaerolineaceae bacterium]|nr:hypothetical protein [Anaerolineaceae bacterium]
MSHAEQAGNTFRILPSSYPLPRYPASTDFSQSGSTPVTPTEVLPSASVTPGVLPTTTSTASLTPTETLVSPTLTLTLTPTVPPTATVVNTVVVEQTVIVPQTIVVPQPIIITPIFVTPIVMTSVGLPPVVTISAPRSVIPQRPTATATPEFGWRRQESSAFVAVIGNWSLKSDANASAGGYRLSASGNARLRFPFTGDAIRFIYQSHPQGGVIGLLLDGQPLDRIDTFSEEATFQLAGPYFLEPGYHVLDIAALYGESGEQAIAIDAVDVFHGPPMPTLESPTAIAVTGESRESISFELVSEPATPQPTSTPEPPTRVTVEVIIAYDLNRNDSAEPNEGVRDMPVRLLDTTINRVLATSTTDERGYARLSTEVAQSVMVVVPYLGETFDIRIGRGTSQTARWTLLLDAANQPGLIP